MKNLMKQDTITIEQRVYDFKKQAFLGQRFAAQNRG